MPFMSAELFDFINNRPKHVLWTQFPIPPQRFDQTLLSEFLFGIVKGFSYPVSVERQRVSGEEWGFRYGAIPLFEEPQYRARGLEPFNGVIASEKKSGEVPAIRVAQAPRVVVIFGEEEGCVSGVGRILVKELIHRSQ